jgi:2-(1,2-epoxy-1,2-dihydrophenyl)acetyl-CoA isomerase
MTLRIESAGEHVRVVTLDRPEKFNAITMSMLDRLDQFLGRCSADDVRVVVLTGADANFSAGYDIPEITAASPADHTVMDLRRHEVVERWFNAPSVTIAALRGVCFGAGSIFATAADLRVAGPDLRFKVTAASYGGANLTWMLHHLVGVGRARDLLLTARAVDGDEASVIGLVERFVDDDEVLDVALDLARSVARLPPEGPRATKRLINQALGSDPLTALGAEHVRQARSLLVERDEPLFAEFGSRTDRRD